MKKAWKMLLAKILLHRYFVSVSSTVQSKDQRTWFKVTLTKQRWQFYQISENSRTIEATKEHAWDFVYLRTIHLHGTPAKIFLESLWEDCCIPRTEKTQARAARGRGRALHLPVHSEKKSVLYLQEITDFCWIIKLIIPNCLTQPEGEKVWKRRTLMYQRRQTLR